MKRSFWEYAFFFLLCCYFFSFSPAGAAAQPEQDSFLTITLHLEGKEHQLQNPLIMREGVTYAPFREIFSLLGSEIGCHQKNGRLLVWANLQGHRFLLEKDSTVFYDNNIILSLPSTPLLLEGTLYFPMRFLLDLAGYAIHWEMPPLEKENTLRRANLHLLKRSPAKLEKPLTDENFAAGDSDKDIVVCGERTAPLTAIFSERTTGVPVLMYHHLLPSTEHDGSNGAIISVENFSEQMDYLFTEGYRTVTLQDLYLFVTGQKDLPPKTVVLTFDDGYESNYRYAYPIMQQYHFRAAQFTLTSYIGKTTCWVERMTPEMMEAAVDVFEYHSHSHDLHYYVGERQAILAHSKDKVREDLQHSRELLNCFAFSYPFGAFNKEIIALLEETGYKMAFTIRPGYVRAGDHPFMLKRLGIYPETTIKDFALILNPS